MDANRLYFQFPSKQLYIVYCFRLHCSFIVKIHEIAGKHHPADHQKEKSRERSLNLKYNIWWGNVFILISSSTSIERDPAVAAVKSKSTLLCPQDCIHCIKCNVHVVVDAGELILTIIVTLKCIQNGVDIELSFKEIPSGLFCYVRNYFVVVIFMRNSWLQRKT